MLRRSTSTLQVSKYSNTCVQSIEHVPYTNVHPPGLEDAGIRDGGILQGRGRVENMTTCTDRCFTEHAGGMKIRGVCRCDEDQRCVQAG